MSNKLMIIAYNDEGKYYVSNYCDGDISATHEMKSVQSQEGFCESTIHLHTDIEMRNLHKHNLTLNDLDCIIDKLKSLREYMTRESEV